MAYISCTPPGQECSKGQRALTGVRSPLLCFWGRGLGVAGNRGKNWGMTLKFVGEIPTILLPKVDHRDPT